MAQDGDMMDDYAKHALIRMFKERALSFGDFTLASGQTSTYYLDAKQVTLTAEGLGFITAGLLDVLEDIPFDCIGGMSIGADPIVGAVLNDVDVGSPLTGFLIRKQPKDHGTLRYIEGPVPDGRAVIVEDVTTTGQSALNAASTVERFADVDVVAIVTVVDRQQGAAQNIAQHGIPFRSLMTAEELGVG